MSRYDADLPSGFDVFDDPELLRELAHPVRSRIFRAAVRQPVSAKEVAQRLNQPVDRISYHFRMLAKAGLIKPVRQTRHRGATETHYRAVASMDISDELEREASPDVKELMGKTIVSDLALDLETEVERGAADEPHFRLARAHFVVDDAGAERLQAEVDAFYRRLEALERELAADGEGARREVNVIVGLYRGEGDLITGANSPFVWGPDPGGGPLPLIGPVVDPLDG